MDQDAVASVETHGRPLLILHLRQALAKVVPTKARALHLHILAPIEQSRHRGVCSGWIEPDLVAYLGSLGVFYAGEDVRLASDIAQLERSTTAVQTALAS